MGFLKNLFGDAKQDVGPAMKTEKNVVYAPISGTAITLEEIGDGVFSAGVLGQGCGLKPDTEVVTAPFDGKITQIADSKHAIGLESGDGIELLIHVGMDTVSLDGKGYTVYVKVGDKVKCGQKLLTFSKSVIAAAGLVDTTAVVVVNSDTYGTVSLTKTGPVAVCEGLLQVQ